KSQALDRPPCTFRSGRSGWPGRCAKRCAPRLVSSRRSIGVASISTRRAERSISRWREPPWATHRESGYGKASRARWIGTAIMGGSSGMGASRLPPSGETSDAPGIAGELAAPQIGRAQEQLFAPGTSSRAKYAGLVVGRSGLAALVKHELIVAIAQARAGALGLVLR